MTSKQAVLVARRWAGDPTVRRTSLGAGVALGLLSIMALIVLIFEGGNVPDAIGDVGPLTRLIIRAFGGGAAFALLYVEESGIPMVIPGDFVVMWVGHHTPKNLVALTGVWLGLTAAVVLGSTNLYLISRKWGRQLVDQRLGRILHLTPARMARADSWFDRWGAWALIFGRHVFGLRVPLTVAAGIFKLPYPIFALSVAVSSAFWIAMFLFLGVTVGGPVAHVLRVYRQEAFVIGVGVLVAAALVVAYRWVATRPRQVV